MSGTLYLEEDELYNGMEVMPVFMSGDEAGRLTELSLRVNGNRLHKQFDSLHGDSPQHFRSPRGLLKYIRFVPLHAFSVDETPQSTMFVVYVDGGPLYHRNCRGPLLHVLVATDSEGELWDVTECREWKELDRSFPENIVLVPMCEIGTAQRPEQEEAA